MKTMNVSSRAPARDILKVLLASLGVTLCGSALAKVPADQAAKLGTTLTPLGAEKAGNTAKTIPDWEPMPQKELRRGSDPFAEDKPLYTITAANLKEHEAQLSEGYKALFRTFPDYKMIVYPTRRSASYPQWFYDATKKNATTVELNNNGY